MLRFTDEEIKWYSAFEPSLLQKVVWFFWPSIVYVKWKEVNQILCGVGGYNPPPKNLERPENPTPSPPKKK